MRQASPIKSQKNKSVVDNSGDESVASNKENETVRITNVYW